jgi:hypothetical protein
MHRTDFVFFVTIFLLAISLVVYLLFGNWKVLVPLFVVALVAWAVGGARAKISGTLALVLYLVMTYDLGLVFGLLNCAVLMLFIYGRSIV